ncbi:MAG: sigma-70 family RNA polymerase sigma factor [Polyangiaceae bacterium]|nr:sigma-70 family RNA polymerase sigma factor [Polyangiaceae bacterium]
MRVAPRPSLTLEHSESTIDSCRRGDRAALERVLRVEAPAVERLLARMIGNAADVEDLLQEVMVAAMVGFATFRGHASVRTWLARIAVKTAYDHLRRPLRRERATLRLVASDGDLVAPAPEHVVDDQRLVERLHRHLDALSPKNRIALVLHVVEGRPMAEVAALMDATVAATKTRVFLGRRALLRRVKGDRTLCELLSGSTTSSGKEKQV